MMSKPSFILRGIFLLALFSPLPAASQEIARFFYTGDGVLVLNGQTISYRQASGGYQQDGLKRIHGLFRAPWEDPHEQLSLRFLEILDYIQDQLKGGGYTLKSGYRSPTGNQSLRNKGKLAAQSSMHIEGAAADLIMGNVPSSQVFDFVKALDCCGIGWYHGRHFHIDTGPSRYWDEATSKTEDTTPQQNEKIILQPDFDRYRPGEPVALKWMRVTEYPIGIPSEFELIKNDDPGFAKKVEVRVSKGPEAISGCRILEGRGQARSLSAELPKDLKPGNYAFRVRFCNRFNYEKMPEMIVSRAFEVR